MSGGSRIAGAEELTFLRYLDRIQRGETWRGVRFSTTGLVIICVDGSDDTTRTSSARTLLKCSTSNTSENSLPRTRTTMKMLDFSPNKSVHR